MVTTSNYSSIVCVSKLFSTRILHQVLLYFNSDSGNTVAFSYHSGLKGVNSKVSQQSCVESQLTVKMRYADVDVGDCRLERRGLCVGSSHSQSDHGGQLGVWQWVGHTNLSCLRVQEQELQVINNINRLESLQQHTMYRTHRCPKARCDRRSHGYADT